MTDLLDPKGRKFSAVGTVVQTDMVTVFTETEGEGLILEGDVTTLTLALTNTGAVALNSFTMYAKMHPDSNFEVLYESADWVVPDGILTVLKGNINKLAAGATAVIIVNVSGIYAINFEAEVSSGETTLTACGMLRHHG